MGISSKRELGKNRESRDGFTLVELLLVITIVAILAAFILSTLSKAKANAQSAACKNHLRQMGQALQMYVQENGNKYPRSVVWLDPSLGDETTNMVYWWARLSPYYGVHWTNRAYHCPGYSGAVAEQKPGQLDYEPPFGSYAYNADGVRPPFSGGESSDGRHYDVPDGNFGLGPHYRKYPIVSESQIVSPSEMFAIGESRFLNPTANGQPGGECYMVCGLFDKGWSPGQFAFGAARHGKNYNQLFCDGHVAAFDPWFLFNPTNTASMWNYDNKPHPELWSPF